MGPDHYATLGVSSSASLADIKKAFRLLASSLHPDKNPSATSARDFAALRAAYSVLSDPEKRLAFDENRRRNLLDDPLAEARAIWQGYFSALL